MKLRIAFCFWMTTLLCAACNNDDTMAKDIVGEWHGVQWTAEGKPVAVDPATVTMVLSKDGVYNLIVDSRIDKGDWHTKKDTLFLVPDSYEDVKIKIISLKGDRLTLQMDRGRIEILEMKR
jgi:hypothetical protein